MPTAYDMIRNGDAVSTWDVIQKTCFPNIDLIPASINLMGFEYETALSSRDPTLLARALGPVLENYDVMIFDTPPQLSFAVMAALFASQGVLIPLNASMLDVMSLASFLGIAGNLMEEFEAHAPDHRFDFIKLLITRYEPMDQAQVQAASILRTALGGSVMAANFLISTDAASSQRTVFEVDRRDVCKKTYDRMIESITRVTAEIQTEIFKAWGRTGARVDPDQFDAFAIAFRSIRGSVSTHLDIES